MRTVMMTMIPAIVRTTPKIMSHVYHRIPVVSETSPVKNLVEGVFFHTDRIAGLSEVLFELANALTLDDMIGAGTGDDGI